jgi:crotonobetaine/carnitine-CoA ligase
MTQQLAIALLQECVSTQPHSTFLKFREGSYSYAGFDQAYRTCAARLAGLGISQRDVVPVFFPNTGPAVEAWFALMHLGAVWAPVNTEFRGAQLSRALNLMEASTLVVDAPYLPQVIEVLPDLHHVTTLVLHGLAGLPALEGVRCLRLEDLPAADLPPPAEVARADVAMIQFTSGSTGMSKAVQLSHGYLAGQGNTCAETFQLSHADVLYCPFPLYHWDATVGTVMAALCGGCAAALARRFSVSGFWDDIRFFGATVFDFMGATLTFIYQQPEQPGDADNPVRLAWGVPVPEFKVDFERRFGLKLIEGYGSTEGGIAVFQVAGKDYPKGSCGEVARGWQLRLLDDAGQPVACGEAGEIVTRPDDPTQMMNGYLKMPEANAELLRDGWYYTGDLGRFDAAGNLYFAGRKKDVIRRRGENMSALEIETVIEAHPAVKEVAAYGVPSRFSEEEVAVAVVVHEGAQLSRAELLEYCHGKMARYMLPEHILFLQALPRTPTEKVAKAELKKRHADLLSAAAAGAGA